jgi:TRAP-type C4-dicarboxylate transport system permease large subunit
MEEIIKPVIPYFIFQVLLVYLLAFFPKLVTVPLKWIGG